jgi:5-methylcytosine-specific restriction endonuclease McrA
MSTTRLAITGEYPPNWREIALDTKRAAGFRCIRCNHIHDIESGHMLTVHHFDGNKSNCAYWNCMPLCQKCHLSVQARVNPQIPYFLEHSPWAKIYIAGFYAFKYEGRQITRQEAEHRLEQLLAYERIA